MEGTKFRVHNGDATNGLSRKEKEYLARRRAILDAAVQLFSAKGYAGASMQEIAQASEFSIGTLYNFFETKESLYLTIVEEKFSGAMSLIEEEVATENGCLGKIRKLVHVILSVTEENRDFFMTLGPLNVPEPDVHGGIHEKVVKYHHEHLRFVQEIMEEGIEAGLFRDFTPLELAYSLIGMCNATIHDWLTGPDGEGLTARLDRILNLFFYGALAKRPDATEVRNA